MNDEDKIQQRVVTTESGQQVFIQDTPKASLTFDIPNDPIVEEKPADQFTIAELQDIFTKPSTDDSESDTMSGNISSLPKETDQMQSTSETETTDQNTNTEVTS